MDSAISSLSSNAAATAATTTSASTQTGTSKSTAFETLLNGLLAPDNSGKINEEQLYAALVNERLTSKVGSDAAATYQSLFTTYEEQLKNADGYVPVEQAASKALAGLVDQGVVTKADAESINAQAFQAAQLDTNTSYLYDSLGSTTAVSLVNAAIQAAETTVNKFDSGELKAGTMPITTDFIQAPEDATSATATEAGASSSFVGGGGFLYKPVSESNGNLVILLPASMKGKVSSLNLVDSTGKVLTTGTSKTTFNDGRPVYRFNEPGSSFPNNLQVKVSLTDGTTKSYTIPDSSQRWS